MRYFVFLLCAGFAAFSSQAQNHQNAPLLELGKKPMGVLEKNVDGWMMSLDGQWMREDNTLRIRANARDEKAYESKDAQLGLDNIERLEMREAFWGTHRIFCLTKYIREGRFRYTQRESGWKEQVDAWYCLIDPADLDQLASIDDTLFHKLDIRLLDAGWLRNTKPGDLKKTLEGRARPNPQFERTLTLYVKYSGDRQKVRFYLVSLHPLFGQPEAVRKDFQLNGESLNGRDEIFRLCHYECPTSEFQKVFPLK